MTDAPTIRQSDTKKEKEGILVRVLLLCLGVALPWHFCHNCEICSHKKKNSLPRKADGCPPSTPLLLCLLVSTTWRSRLVHAVLLKSSWFHSKKRRAAKKKESLKYTGCIHRSIIITIIIHGRVKFTCKTCKQRKETTSLVVSPLVRRVTKL